MVSVPGTPGPKSDAVSGASISRSAVDSKDFRAPSAAAAPLRAVDSVKQDWALSRLGG